jgi:outer membrane protein
MKTPPLLPLLAALGAVLAHPVQAQSLRDLYESARGFDAAYLAARSQFDANLAYADQAKASVLPTARLTLEATRTDGENTLTKPKERRYGTENATLSLSQPLYRPGNWAHYQQGLKLPGHAQAQLEGAEQDLIIRVSQAYFDVLALQDSLTFVQAQKAAVAEQLATAKVTFEVGTSTITDTHEAQARFDLVLAQEIAAENNLLVKKIALDQLVGRADAQPRPLTLPLVIPRLLPNEVKDWVAQSQTAHFSVKQSQIDVEVAQLETVKAQAGHKPTLDLTASYTVNNNRDGSSNILESYRINNSTIGLSFNLPLFAGFAVQNRIRETLALEDKARNELDGALRGAAQGTRTAFFGLLSGQAQVKALEAAEVSSQSALDSNKLGYTVGERINSDVLNAQSQLYQTKRDLARARYDLLVNGLKLRQANGTLQVEDLLTVNRLLAL